MKYARGYSRSSTKMFSMCNYMHIIYARVQVGAGSYLQEV